MSNCTCDCHKARQLMSASSPDTSDPMDRVARFVSGLFVPEKGDKKPLPLLSDLLGVDKR
jgi:hypothetical protein